MRNITKIIGCALSVFAFSSLAGQILTPVTWSFDSKKTGDNEYDLVLTAKIDKGCHIYTLETLNLNAGPIGTLILFLKSKDYSLIGKTIEMSEVTSKYDKCYEHTTNYFEDKAIFVQHIKTNGKPGKIKGSLGFSCCNGMKNPQAKTMNFEINLNK